MYILSPILVADVIIHFPCKVNKSTKCNQGVFQSSMYSGLVLIVKYLESKLWQGMEIVYFWLPCLSDSRNSCCCQNNF